MHARTDSNDLHGHHGQFLGNGYRDKPCSTPKNEAYRDRHPYAKRPGFTKKGNTTEGTDERKRNRYVH